MKQHQQVAWISSIAINNCLIVVQFRSSVFKGCAHVNNQSPWFLISASVGYNAFLSARFNGLNTKRANDDASKDKRINYNNSNKRRRSHNWYDVIEIEKESGRIQIMEFIELHMLMIENPSDIHTYDRLKKIMI